MKKICFIFTIMLLFSVKVFSAPEISFSIPISINSSTSEVSILGSDHYYLKSLEFPQIVYNNIKDRVGFNTGFLVRAGENFVFKNEGVTGFSVLVDLGYYMQSYFMQSDIYSLGKPYFTNHAKINTFLHTVNLGMLIKLNTYAIFGNMFDANIKNTTTSFGIGAGLKVPISATEIIELYENKNNYAYYDKKKRNYSYNDVKDMFKSQFIPYIKIMSDLNIFINHLTALNIEIYSTYNFDIEYVNTKQKTMVVTKEAGLMPIVPPEYHYFKKYSFSSLEIGVAIGMTIGGFNLIKNKSASANIY